MTSLVEAMMGSLDAAHRREDATREAERHHLHTMHFYGMCRVAAEVLGQLHQQAASDGEYIDPDKLRGEMKHLETMLRNVRSAGETRRASARADRLKHVIEDVEKENQQAAHGVLPESDEEYANR